MQAQRTVAGTCLDLLITLLLWTYYLLGFFLFFAPFYLAALTFPGRREILFQILNSAHHRVFFRLLRFLAPRVQWRIADDVRSIRSSVIIANHLSFLDPILFTSLFRQQKTVVKPIYFRLPVFGQILKFSGYIAPIGDRQNPGDTMHQVRRLSDYLVQGGNLFVFPEGTRSRSGHLGAIDKGAFRMARLCKAPIKVVLIRGTDRLFPPDRFLFSTLNPCMIEVTLAGTIETVRDGVAVPIPDLMRAARVLLEGESAA